MHPKPWTLIGTFLVREGFISEEELQAALATQEGDPTKPLLGDVCIEMGLCTAANVQTALACKDASQLVRKPTTETAMAAFRESVAKVRVATKEHLNGRKGIHANP